MRWHASLSPSGTISCRRAAQQQCTHESAQKLDRPQGLAAATATQTHCHLESTHAKQLSTHVLRGVGSDRSWARPHPSTASKPTPPLSTLTRPNKCCTQSPCLARCLATNAASGSNESCVLHFSSEHSSIPRRGYLCRKLLQSLHYCRTAKCAASSSAAHLHSAMKDKQLARGCCCCCCRKCKQRLLSEPQHIWCACRRPLMLLLRKGVPR